MSAADHEAAIREAEQRIEGLRNLRTGYDLVAAVGFWLSLHGEDLIEEYAALVGLLQQAEQDRDEALDVREGLITPVQKVLQQREEMAHLGAAVERERASRVHWRKRAEAAEARAVRAEQERDERDVTARQRLVRVRVLEEALRELLDVVATLAYGAVGGKHGVTVDRGAYTGTNEAARRARAALAAAAPPEGEYGYWKCTCGATRPLAFCTYAGDAPPCPECAAHRPMIRAAAPPSEPPVAVPGGGDTE